jgi:hypothetical protein
MMCELVPGAAMLVVSIRSYWSWRGPVKFNHSKFRTLEGLVPRFDSFPEIKRVSGVKSDRLPQQPVSRTVGRVRETREFEGTAPFFRWGKRKRARGRGGDGRERRLLGVLAARAHGGRRHHMFRAQFDWLRSKGGGVFALVALAPAICIRFWVHMR